MHEERAEHLLLALLESLAAAQPTAMSEGLLHHAMNLRLANRGQPQALLSEFEQARDLAERRRWTAGARGPTGRVRWALTPAGAAALADLAAP
jgi:hypothetical protein